jgi:hypothetical protein
MNADELRKILGEIVTRAHADQRLKERLLKDPNAVAKEYGLRADASAGSVSATAPSDEWLVVRLPGGEMAGLKSGLVYGCRIGPPPYTDSQHDHWIFDPMQGGLVYVNRMALDYRLMTGRWDARTPIVKPKS